MEFEEEIKKLKDAASKKGYITEEDIYMQLVKYEATPEQPTNFTSAKIKSKKKQRKTKAKTKTSKNFKKWTKTYACV